MTEALTFKGHKPVWDNDVKFFRMFYRSEVHVTRSMVPAHGRYYEFIGMLVEEADDIIDVQVYGWCPPPFRLVFRRKAMPTQETKWRL